MLGRDGKVDLISKVPLFSGCSKRELRDVAQIADEIDLAQGKVLCREGDVGREFFVLLEGACDVHRKGRKIDTLRSGEFFGEVALISDAPRNATVTSTTPLRVLVIVDRDFRGLIKASPGISAKVLAAIVGRLAPEKV